MDNTFIKTTLNRTELKFTLIWNIFLVSSTLALASKISQSERGMMPAVGSVCQSAEPDSFERGKPYKIIPIYRLH